MAIAIHLRFPAGRYHATGWGHHVNEAVIDWPPAPFRLLRAIYAQAYRLEEPPPRSTLEELFGALATPPAYRTPPYTLGHTRHYMPTNKTPIEKGRVQVLDAFVAVDPTSTLVAQWDHVELSAEAETVLATLLGCLTYLGRAESWCDAVLGEPVDHAVGPGEGDGEPVSLLALKRETRDVLGALDTRTDRLRKAGSSVPKDSTWVRYFIGPPSRPRRPLPGVDTRAPFALFQLDAGARPRILDAVDVADRFRRALLSKVGDRHAPLLCGKDESGAPLKGHAHAHYLPFDLDGDGRISHLAVWAQDGLRIEDLEAMGHLHSVYRRDRGDPLAVTLLEVGNREILGSAPFVGYSRRWRSHTPFLLGRHPKQRGGRDVDSPEDQLARELERRGLPRLVSAERIVGCSLPKGRVLRWLEFRRWRGRRNPAVPEPFGFEIELEEPIDGPLCLGFGSHFGLGMFVAVET